MSTDIDMQNYGRDFSQPAAGVATMPPTNSYQEDPEFPVQTQLLSGDYENLPPAPEINPQAENFRALREEVDRIKNEKDVEKREYQAQIDMLKANINQRPQEAPRPPSPERKMFEGMEDSDVPNVRELRQEWNAREQGYKQRLEELQFQQEHPDYNEVLSKHLGPLVQQKPHLARAIQGSENPALMAYELGKMYQASQQVQTPIVSTPQLSENAQRIVENARKPGTLAQAGGQSTLSQADYFATMSDQEFMRLASKNLDSV